MGRYVHLYYSLKYSLFTYNNGVINAYVFYSIVMVIAYDKIMAIVMSK